MKKLAHSALVLLLTSWISHAQLANGSSAYEISANDINNNGYSLTAAMAGGKSACIDFMATWCGPCWSFHTSQILKNVHNNLSALTTVVMIEGDFATNTNCLYGSSGCTGKGTQGNWVAGVPYPIIDLTSSNGGSVMNDYNVNYYPTLYVISPDFRVWEIKNRSYDEYYNWIVHSFSLNATAQVTHSTCGDNGRVDLTPTGGYSLLKYKWSNGATTEDLVNIPGGTYSVTVTDANGYFESYGPWTVDGPSRRVGIVSQTVVHNDCFGFQKGRISVQVSYGTPGYNYSWSNGGTTNEIKDLPAGSYTLTITDAAGCTTTRNYQITEPPLLTGKILVGHETCDSRNGFIAITAQGGTRPYYYDIGSGKKTNSVFDKLKGGTYKVILTDSKNCLYQEEAVLDATHKPKTVAGAPHDLICGRDTVFLEGFGTETGNDLVYTWSTRGGLIAGDSNNLQIRAVKEGVYFLKVKNLITGCENTDSTRVFEKRILPDIAVSADTFINCYHPSAELEGLSKNQHARHFWTRLESTFKDTSSRIRVGEGGKFVFHVLDTITGCAARDTVFVREDLRKPYVEFIPVTNLSCVLQELRLDASPSENGPDFTTEWITGDGNILEGSSGYRPLVDKGGTYVMILTDKRNGCQSVESYFLLQDTLHPRIEFPPIQDLSCKRSELVLENIHDDASWSYSWMTQDGNILDSAEKKSVRVDQPGWYQLTVLNQRNGCQSRKDQRVFKQTEPRSSWSHQTEDLKVTFADQSEGVPRSWHWEFGDGTVSAGQNPVHTYANPANYDVCLTVGNDCGQSTSCRLMAIGSTNRDLNFSTWEISHISCHGGSDGRIGLTVQGGIPPYVYEWSQGGRDSVLTSIQAGDYSVTVTDQAGTRIQRSFVIKQPSALELAELKVVPVTAQNLGSIKLTISGGVPPYAFVWSHGGSTADVDSLQKGSYWVEVRDANGCILNLGPFEIIDVSSIQDADDLIHLELMPNPARHAVQIKYSFSGISEDSPVRIVLMDLQGVIKKEHRSGASENSLMMDLGGLPGGLYILDLRSPAGHVRRKLQVLH